MTDKNGTSHGFVENFSGDAKPSITSTPIDVQMLGTTSPTQSGGPYDVSSVSDYKRFALRSFHSGAAQESYDIEDASPSRFYESLNLDISEKGILKLGPATTSYVTSPSTIQGVTYAGLGVVWQSFDPAGSDPRNQLCYSTDNVTWTAVTYNGTDPTGNVTALACDGEYMYAAFSGSNGIWKGKASATTWTEYADVATDDADGVVALCHCGGYLYGTKGTTAPVASSLAYVDGTTAWTAATLSASSVIQGVNTVGLVSIGPFVYWVTYGGSVTRVYAAQKGATADENVFQQVAEFPRGFIGNCAYAYLGTLYVGGYYDSYTTDRGIGAIYLLSGNDTSLLTMIGANPTQDWRVLFIGGYEKHLYFVANNSIYKWSLEHGGYSHVCSVAGGVTPAASITWKVTESMTAEPADPPWTIAEVGTVADTQSTPTGQTTWVATTGGYRTYTDPEATLAATTGSTIEADITDATCAILGVGGWQWNMFLALYDGTYYARAAVQTYAHSGFPKRFALQNAATAWVYSEQYSSVDGVLRMTSKNGVANLYYNDTEIIHGVSCQTTAEQQAYFQFGHSTNTAATNTTTLDQLRYSVTGAHDPTVGVTTSSGNLACLRDELWVSATDVGIYKTNSAENTTGYLVTSRSASHMQTVSKFYRAVEVTTESVLRDDQTLKVEWAIDGVWGGGDVLTATTSTTAKHVWNINQSGCDIRLKLTLAKTSSLGPRITGAACKYLLPNQKLHTFYLTCVDGTKMRNGQIWDVPADTAITFILGLTDEYVTIETDYDSSIEAKIEDVQLFRLNREPSENCTYQGVLKVAARELA